MALLTTIRDLHRRKARERRGLALAEGVRLVEEMVAADVACKGVAVAPVLDTTPRGSALLDALAERQIPIERISDAELDAVAATEHPQGIVAVYAPTPWVFADLRVAPRRPVVLLDGVQDPGNVGTIARTALAFGAAGIVALAGTVDLTNPKVVRAAMGALFRLPHLHADEVAAFEWLRSGGVAAWATAMEGEVVTAAPEAPIALLFGNEGAGVRPELLRLAERRVTIPIQAEAESLNVAVAAGILLHQVTQ